MSLDRLVAIMRRLCDPVSGCAHVANHFARPCYGGPAGTADVGACRSGLETCSAGGLGACVGQVTPGAETCNGADDDCNGLTDEPYTDKGAPCSAGTGICLASGVRICRADGTGSQPVVTGGNNENPHWSADGRHLVFASDRDGAYGLWVSDLDGAVPRKLDTGGRRALSPAWSPRRSSGP